MSIRPVLWPDVRAAARVLMDLPTENRVGAFRQMLARAEAADLFRKRYRRWHPLWGNGSLGAVPGSFGKDAEPVPGDYEFALCLEVVFAGLVNWRAEKTQLTRRRRKCTSELRGRS